MNSIFNEYESGKLKNRIVVAPMCMNSSKEKGKANDFHLAHYGSYAMGGAGLITIEAVAIEKCGRIYEGDLCLYDDEQIEPLKRVIDFCHEFSSKVSVQINHAGRKGLKKEKTIGPSKIQFSERYNEPIEMSKEDIKRTVELFKEAARRAVECGADALEIHGAHGYLIDQFLSPLSNIREDEYGGSTENRTRFLMEVIDSFKSVMPESMPLILRVSATDWKEGGIDIDEMVNIINLVKSKIDFVHVSTGGLVKDAVINAYPLYQVEFSKIIKERCNVKTIAVGLIDNKEQAQSIIDNKEADLVALGRAFLRDPNWVLNQSKDSSLAIEQLKRGYDI